MAKPKRSTDQLVEEVPKSLKKGLMILELVAASENPVSTLHIAEHLDLPSSTASRLAIALVSLGYLDQSPATLHYTLGQAALRLSLARLSDLDLRSVATPLMRPFCELLGADADLGLPLTDEILYVELVKKNGPLVVTAEVNYRMPMETTAGGHAALAALPAEQQKQTLSLLKSRKRYDWRKIQRDIQNSLSQIRERGFCLVEGTWRPDIVAIGVPFVDPRNGRIYSFSSSVVRYDRARRDALVKSGPKFVQIVRDVGRALGGK